MCVPIFVRDFYDVIISSKGIPREKSCENYSDFQTCRGSQHIELQTDLFNVPALAYNTQAYGYISLDQQPGENQHGFRGELSVVSQLLVTVNDFATSINNEAQTDRICRKSIRQGFLDGVSVWCETWQML